jgi:hypothetical protein
MDTKLNRYRTYAKHEIVGHSERSEESTMGMDSSLRSQ